MQTIPNPEIIVYADELACQQAGYRPTWGLGERWVAHMVQDAHCQVQPTPFYEDETQTVTLGHRETADQQWQQDMAQGGLVALVCNR